MSELTGAQVASAMKEAIEIAKKVMQPMRSRNTPLLYDMLVVQYVIAKLSEAVLLYAYTDGDHDLHKKMHNNIDNIWAFFERGTLPKLDPENPLVREMMKTNKGQKAN